MEAVLGGSNATRRSGSRGRRGLVAIAAGALIAGTPATLAQAHDEDDHLRTVTDGLDGPRGLAVLSSKKFVVAEGDGTFSLVKTRHGHDATVTELGSVPPGFIAPALDVGRHGTVYILTTGGPPGTGAATLYKWRPGYSEPRVLADIAAYQAGDPDPDDLEGHPEESNPFGVAALKDGTVLVSDAAGNDLLRVYRNGDIKTVARLKPRVVKVPAGLPEVDPEGNPTNLPPAGTRLPSEGVATSVTVGDDGYWYVGELRGFPATPGKSQIWRIKPGSTNAVCDPEKPYKGKCKRYADGLTSIVDLAADDDDNIYALELSKKSWLQWELGVEDGEIGGLFKVSRHGKKIRELVEDQLILPGNVDIGRDDKIFVTHPVFGPGAISRVVHDD